MAMKVEKDVEISKYIGRWYEIASIPSRFQPKDGINTRATYTLNPEGTINVLNETWTTSNNKRSFINGVAFKTDILSDEPKFKVQFWVPPFLPIFPVTGDYWILSVGRDYEFALVGQPSRRFLWVLCRQPHMEEEVYKELLEKASEQGYDVSKLVKTTHTEPPPEGDEGPKDTKGLWWLKSMLGAN